MHPFLPGEDPLADPVTPISLDSVAGALKLFFRGLQPPLLPPELYNDLIATDRECVRLGSGAWL